MLHFLQKSSIGLLLMMLSVGSFGQKTVIFEKMRCYSMMGPSMQYLENPQNQLLIARQFSQTLKNELQLQLNDSINLPVQVLSKEDLATPFTITFKNADTGKLHLYFDCIELTPYTYFNQHTEMLADSNLFRRSESVLQLKFYLVNYKNQLVSQGNLAVSLATNISRSIGIPYRRMLIDKKTYTLPTTSSAFTETIRKSIQYLFRPSNESDLIEVRVPPAFVYNNFITEETYQSGLLIFPSSGKGVWEYTLSEGVQIIRNGERKAFSIPLNNKKLANNSPLKEYWSLLKDENTIGTEYFVFKNTIREVVSNSNYEMLLVTSVSFNRTQPNINTLSTESQYFHSGYFDSNFEIWSDLLKSNILNNSRQTNVKMLNKQVNFLLKETDTIAVFEVRQDTIVKDSSKLWPFQVYDGLDAASLFTLSLPNNPTPFNSVMEITGLIEKQPFVIKLKGSILDWKEIILNGETVAWVMGLERPDKIFIKKFSLEAKMLNQLLMIAFSPFSITLDVPVEMPDKR